MHINCYAKTVRFQEFFEDEDMFALDKQVRESLRDDVEMLVILASLEAKGNEVVCDLPIICDFPEYFLKTSMI